MSSNVTGPEPADAGQQVDRSPAVPWAAWTATGRRRRGATSRQADRCWLARGVVTRTALGARASYRTAMSPVTSARGRRRPPGRRATSRPLGLERGHQRVDAVGHLEGRLPSRRRPARQASVSALHRSTGPVAGSPARSRPATVTVRSGAVDGEATGVPGRSAPPTRATTRPAYSAGRGALRVDRAWSLSRRRGGTSQQLPAERQRRAAAAVRPVPRTSGGQPQHGGRPVGLRYVSVRVTGAPSSGRRPSDRPRRPTRDRVG